MDLSEETIIWRDPRLDAPPLGEAVLVTVYVNDVMTAVDVASAHRDHRRALQWTIVGERNPLSDPCDVTAWAGLPEPAPWSRGEPLDP